MNNIGLLLTGKSPLSLVIGRYFSVSSISNKSYSCKLLVLGGGSGGCTMAAKFAKISHTKDSIIVLEPSKDHYYQPLWTLVGAGAKRLEDTRRDMVKVLPTGPLWLQDYAEKLCPDTNQVFTRKGDVIKYEFIIISVGLVYDYHKITGLEEALEDPFSRVSTIYDHRYVSKVFNDFRCFRGGNAVFTYPNTLIKCPGAPQKIAYLADSYFTKSGIRPKTCITYNTCLPVIFGVKKYADVLLKVAERKNININYKTVLTCIDKDRKEAVFTTAEGEKCTRPYDLLHVVPPMRTPDVLFNNKELTDAAGFLDVDQYTLQSTRYCNMYGIGDCTTTPNSKTAAAIAKQSYVVEKNMLLSMHCKEPTYKYDGYGACPLVTSYHTCILAEFLYGGVVHETFPFDQLFQSAESRIAYYMKRDLFPFIYWNFMLKGYYHGPEFVRKIVNPFAK